MRRMVFGILCTALCAALSAGAAPLTYYVATNGNDAWTGMLPEPNAAGNDGPFATLERARDAIRTVKGANGLLPPDGIEVQVRGGAYYLEQPFVLSAEDSGSKDTPIVYRASPGEEVRLVGGKRVAGFASVTDPAALACLFKAAANHVVQADLGALGIKDFGSPKGGGMELFFDGKPMILSRWPNQGFVKIAEEAGGEKFDVRGRKGDRIGKWTYDGDRPERWTGEKDLWVHGYWFWDWSDQRHRVKALDVVNKLIEVEPPYHTYGYRRGQWYYAYNLLSEIDSPGEWYADRENGVLYFWPPSPVGEAEAVVSILSTLVSIENVSHMTFRGFTLEAVRGTALRVAGGSGNRIVACTIRNGGSEAVSVSDGTDHGVIGCDIYDMGGGGIGLRGGDRKSLTPAGHFAENNHIHDYGRFYRMYKTAVSLTGVGNRASNNLIHNAPHMAIGFSGNDHLIEFNEIHSVCYESNDAGAMYNGRDWTMRGTVIRNNFLHDISGFEGKGCVGVYLDDMLCGTRIEGNLFCRVTRAAFIGGGRDNIVENNVFVDCHNALHIDDRALTWASYHVDTTMKERLDAMPFGEAPWKDRYPELLTLYGDEPGAPKGNRVTKNLFYGGKWNDVLSSARPYQTIENNLADQDPGFATPERMKKGLHIRPKDFALRTDASALDVGFTPLPLEKMGLYEDGNRASWPVSHTVRPVEER